MDRLHFEGQGFGSVCNLLYDSAAPSSTMAWHYCHWPPAHVQVLEDHGPGKIEIL